MNKEDYEFKLTHEKRTLGYKIKQRALIATLGLALSGTVFISQVPYLAKSLTNLARNPNVTEIMDSKLSENEKEEELEKIVGKEYSNILKNKKAIDISSGIMASSSILYGLIGVGLATTSYFKKRKYLKNQVSQTNL